MKYLVALICFLSLNQVQASNFSEALKSHADTIPRGINKNHKETSAYLVGPCKNASEKVQIISYWIAKNVKYDLAENKWLGRNKTAQEVINDKRAVCGGYSALFKQMCDNEGIPCFYIKGYADGSFWEKAFSKDKSLRHAWNIVYIEREWKLVDVTWQNEYLKSEKFKKGLEMEWIFVPPGEFAKTHYPFDPMWQMLKDPYTKDEFFKGKKKEHFKFNYLDTLNSMLEKDWVEAELTTIRGQFRWDEDANEYMKNLIILGWELVGGAYDSTETARAQVIFKLAEHEHARLEPFKEDKDRLKEITTGQWLCRRRLEMEE